MRILFVDDDPAVLSGLRRMLRPRARDWEMLFAVGGREALSMIDEAPVDVVVTDMRMPEIDGAALLDQVRSRHPDTVRIVLSGHTEKAMALRSAQVAHQFLTKPCDPDHLKATVQRACELRDRLASVALRRVVGELETLPSAPRVVTELNTMLAHQQASLDAVGDLVATDPALSAKLLQLVNSAFFGLGHRLMSVREAVSYLGLNVLRNLVVASSAFDAFYSIDVGRRFLEDEQANALEVASLGCELMPQAPAVHDAFVAGLLHDVGNLVLASALPEEYRAARQRAVDEGISWIEAEREAFGTSHAEVGAYLLSLWGLPNPILEAVARHHDAPSLPEPTLEVVHATFVASCLADERDRSGRHGPGGSALTPEYLAALGITSQVQAIRDRRSASAS